MKIAYTSALKPHPELGTDAVLPRLSDSEFEGLKQSIDESGILQSIVIDRESMTIIDGHHRWRAAKELGLEQVPVRAPDFDDEEDRMRVGVKLNAHRRQMTGEQKRAAIAALLKGDPKQSNRSVADAVGVDHKTVAPVREEMEAAGEIPHHETRVGRDGVEQPATKPKPDPTSSWKPERKEAAEKMLAALPEQERDAVKALVGPVHETAAIGLVENLTDMEPEERAEVLTLHESEDPRDQSLALSKAAKMPPNMDPRVGILGKAQAELRKAIRFCDRDTTDEIERMLAGLVDSIESIREQILQTPRAA